MMISMCSVKKLWVDGLFTIANGDSSLARELLTMKLMPVNIS